MTASWLTSSSKAPRTSLYLSLPLPLRDGFFRGLLRAILQVTLYLGFETSALIISVRGLAYNASAALCSMVIT